MSNHPQILKLPSEEFIAYHKTEGKTNKPGIVFLGGFMSDMQGTKALALEDFCKQNELNFVRFDYFGHGQSSGVFTDGTIGLWKENVLTVLDELTEGPQILVGSSMGGWLMLLATLERPERIVGVLGVASAPDFTENLIWDKLDDEARKTLQSGEIYALPSDYDDSSYPLAMNLIQEGRNHLLLGNKININVPVRLLHGMLDKDVPCELSVKISQQITSDNVCVSLVPFADHRMSTNENIELLCDTLKDMVEKYEQKM